MIVAFTGGRGCREAATVARELDALGVSVLVHGRRLGKGARRPGASLPGSVARPRPSGGLQGMRDQWRPALVLG